MASFESTMGIGLIVLLFCHVALAGDRVEYRQERINGALYSVEYRLSAEGDLTAKPTHIMTTTGWLLLDPQDAPKGDLRHSRESGRVVNIGDKTFAVVFQTGSQGGLGAVGLVYSKKENGQWNSIVDSASTEKKTEVETKPQLTQEAKPEPKQSKPEVKSAATHQPESVSKPETKPSRTGTSPVPAAVPARAATKKGDPLLAEFSLSEAALSKFKMTVRDTTPFIENGRWVYPDTSITVATRPLDSTHNGSLRVDATVSGTAVSSGGENRMGRYTGATVRSNISGTLSREMIASPTEITAGAMRGDLNSTYNVATQTQFRLPMFRNMALRRAAQEAHSSAQRSIPGKQAELRRQIDEGTRNGAASADKALKERLDQLNSLGTKAEDLPFRTQVSSRGRGDGKGALNVSLYARDDKARAARPELKAEGAATSLYLHQDAVNESLKPLLAGKKLNLGETAKIICRIEMMRKIDFCRDDIPADIAGTTLYLDKEEPFSIAFEDQKVILRIRATHEKPMGPQGLLMKGKPSLVEITYRVTPQKLERTSVKVSSLSDLAEASQPKVAGMNHEFGFNKLARFLSDPLSGAELALLSDSYSKSFKEQVEMPEIVLPGNTLVTNPRSNKSTRQVLSKVAFRPLEAIAQDGWFATSQQAVEVK